MPDPVIVLAAPRSFTSVVGAMLGQHPQMYGLPEVNLFVAETISERAGAMAGRGPSHHGLLRVIAQLFAGEQTVQTTAYARRWLEKRANRTCVSVFRELAEKVSPRVLVDKSPRTIMRAESLQRVRRAFPSARFIHLLRHPRSQCESIWNHRGHFVADRMGALDYSTTPPMLDFQRAWYKMQVNIITFLDGVPEGQKIRIRGEDVLADPDTHLRQTAEWLGVSADEEAIEAMKHPERSPYASFGPPNAALGNNPRFLDSPILHRRSRAQEPTLEGPLGWRPDGRGFSPEVKELASEFGYR